MDTRCLNRGCLTTKEVRHMASPLDARDHRTHLRTAYTDTAPAAPPLACGITLGRSLRDDLAEFEDRDGVGELVRLLEVLRRQEDRDAAGDEVADDPPHGVAAARVEAGGRLVEEIIRGLPTRVIARSSRRRIPPE